jgi:hypothetical protein
MNKSLYENRINPFAWIEQAATCGGGGSSHSEAVAEPGTLDQQLRVFVKRVEIQVARDERRNSYRDSSRLQKYLFKLSRA